ncbi:M16 family metallopeptidase [Fulvimonas soli]|jgi:predicted Zn-dependent peptidase|uniref:Putative Zn-dependent peptidase n=1 Tax=Fulvimonas soli TaxID=155197 RepID=A0A316IG75_9GAMM|nr:pitrilysin family protein [Fulvimonas soli]PWK92331.1 putative Zn-dependent peptidase [Fulvimonas soli]TNY28005.1 peptidase M16 [Fulvimonas soli]
MRKKPLALLAASLCSFAFGAAPSLAAPAPAAAPSIPELAYQRFVLPNGLTVVVHEDHKAPVVAVSVWYHVGSSYEPAGKTGFAHLFEHLMFQGSENHKDEYFKPFELAGATDMNGTTWLDRTNYFETVPTTALDMALWMESDRMGHLLGAIGQAQLDEQRGVVQNEKRQDENQPYGRVGELIQAEAFPANHPYHHDTIGSMADLNAASLADVKQWFRDYYGAANTVVVLAGDVTPAQAREKMLRYFGDIAPGPRVPRPQPWVAPRSESTRGTMTDNVAQVRIYREWNVPSRTDAELNQLQLAAAVLGGGKTSRLYQRLVYRDRLADDVSVDIEQHVLASLFQLQVDVKKGVDPARVEAAVAEEWARFLKDGPSADELEREKTTVRAAFVRGLEKVNTQASILAEGQLYQGDPGAYLKDFRGLMAATPASVKAAANQWIARGDYTLTVVPGKVEAQDLASSAGRPAAPGKPAPVLSPAGDFRTVKSGVDRGQGVPAVTRFPDLSFPSLQHGRLANGIPVVLAERHTVPAVQLQLLFDAGYAADQGRKLGTSSFTMAMLDEGTARLDSVEIAKRKQRLGAAIASGCGLDHCNVSLNALDDKLAPSLDLFADIVRNPALRDADVARVRGQWLAGIAQEKSQPVGIALRTLPPLLYGKGHAYAIPFTGSGTEASIKALGTEDMRAFLRDYIRPDNAKILVAGDTTLAAIIPQLDRVFGDWKAPAGKVPAKNLAEVAPPGAARVFLVDRPGAQQSLILAGSLAPSTRAANDVEIQTMNGAFGGTFTSRLNMNLREDKHWAYGAFSFLRDAQGQRPFLLYAPVQTDKTAPSAAEILKESRAVVGDRPLTAEEIAKIKVGDVRSMPGRYQTTSAVMGALQDIALYDRPDDYVQTLKARIDAQKDADVEAAAKELIHPDRFTWVIVGDLRQIEAPVRALKLGEVQVLDADGNPAPAR